MKFGLISQMRRDAVSIPANIAEGFKRKGKKDKTNFYNIAQASLEESRYYLILSKDLQYLQSNDNLLGKIDEVAKLLYKFIGTIMP